MPTKTADLAFAGATRLVELLRAGEVTPRELVELYLERIERIDPQLNAFRKVFADRALVEADQAGARLKAGDDRPLLGLPVAIKDEMGVQGEVLMFGSNAHSGEPEERDWEIVRRLRAAGAIVLGVTHVPELTIWPVTESATFGFTRNPWDPQRTPGGSSGGSAAAVAAGLVPLATASDGGGSIRIPASCCGLVGLKPQRGRIPYTPMTEHWEGLSVLGFEARTVADAALAYEAVTGVPYVAAAAKDPAKLRIALSTAFPPVTRGGIDPQVRRSVTETAEVLRGLGHEVVEQDPDYGLAASNFFARYVAGISADAAAMAHPSRLEPRTKTMARLGRLFGKRGLARARAAEAQDARRIFAIFDDVDVILHPGLAQLPLPVGKLTGAGALRTFNGVASWVPWTAIYNHLGNPGLVVPVGMSAEGLPLTVQLVGPSDSEELLLSLGGQLERARPWADRRPPLATA